MCADRLKSSRAERNRFATDNDVSPSALSDFRAYSQVTGQETVIYAQNSITAGNSGPAHEVLLQHANRSKTPVVVLDLEKAEIVDTTGLGVLVEIRKILASANRRVEIQNPSRALLRIMNITSVSRLFPVRTSRPAEQQRLGQPLTPPRPDNDADKGRTS
ncbi:MAG: STAS domain-containing protein [Candidatus Sumerlaeaceae bacterium]|nr:STAS domain-containing protein [Candidatus Sumerlaeaceae bacterium]